MFHTIVLFDLIQMISYINMFFRSSTVYLALSASSQSKASVESMSSSINYLASAALRISANPAYFYLSLTPSNILHSVKHSKAVIRKYGLKLSIFCSTFTSSLFLELMFYQIFFVCAVKAGSLLDVSFDFASRSRTQLTACSEDMQLSC